MTTGNRGNIRSGRTPPLILIGLLLIIGYLSYCYWSLSNSHGNLEVEVDSLKLQKKDVDDRNFETEKNLELAREEQRLAQGNLEQARKQLQDKDAENLILKTDISSKQSDVEKYKSQLGHCDTSLAEQKSSYDALKFEKEELSRSLAEIKPSCTFEACAIHIRSILAVVAKITDSKTLGKALTAANFDAYKLLEGIKFPELVIQQSVGNQQELGQIQQQQGQIQQQQGQNQQQQGQNQQNQQQQGQNQQQQAQIQQPKQNQQGLNQPIEGHNQQQVVKPNQEIVNLNQQESQVKGSTDVANTSIVKDVSVAENSVTQPKGNKDNSSILGFQTERNKNIVEITDKSEKAELERQRGNEAADITDALQKNGDEENENEKVIEKLKEENIHGEDKDGKNLVKIKDSHQIDGNNIET